LKIAAGLSGHHKGGRFDPVRADVVVSSCLSFSVHLIVTVARMILFAAVFDAPAGRRFLTLRGLQLFVEVHD